MFFFSNQEKKQKRREVATKLLFGLEVAIIWVPWAVGVFVIYKSLRAIGSSETVKELKEGVVEVVDVNDHI